MSPTGKGMQTWEGACRGDEGHYRGGLAKASADPSEQGERPPSLTNSGIAHRKGLGGAAAKGGS